MLIDLDRINRIICAHYIQLVASAFLFQLFAIFSHLHQSSLPLPPSSMLFLPTILT